MAGAIATGLGGSQRVSKMHRPIDKSLFHERQSGGVEKAAPSAHRVLGLDEQNRVFDTSSRNASASTPVLSPCDRRKGAIHVPTDLCWGELVAETAVARLAIPGRPLDMGCCAETWAGAELSRDISRDRASVSIGAVGIMDAVATPSSIFCGSGQISASGGGVGPVGGQGGSGYDVDASLTVYGASDKRALFCSMRLGLADVDGGMEKCRLSRVSIAR
ncbi:hypothetical protein QBC39DRAFT_168454 [Podospora conica]|nr:hypothetical protein QBC39DRAFT_168454 [Schizothecium conicum]